MSPHSNSPPGCVHPTHKVTSLFMSFSPESLLLQMVNDSVLKYCKWIVKGNASQAEDASLHGARGRRPREPHESQAQLIPFLPWKVVGWVYLL